MLLRSYIQSLILEFFDQKLSCIGLVTAQNPQEQQQAEKYNKSANARLLDDITQMGYEPFPTHYYGENGYLVPGISKSNLIKLGNKYNQRAVIWGEKIPHDRNGMTFKWQYMEDGKIRGEKISHHPFVCPKFP